VTTHRVEVSIKTMLAVVCVAALCFVAIKLWSVIIVIIMAMLFVGTLSPSVRWLERHRIKRTLAVVIVFLGLFIVVVGLSTLTLAPLISQVQAVVAHEPELRKRAAEMLASSHYTEGLSHKLRDIKWDALAANSAMPMLTASSHVIETLAYAASAIFLAAYIILDSDRLLAGMFALMPRQYHVRASRVLLNLEMIVGGYIRGQAVTCALMAVFTWIVLAACGVPNGLALAMFAGVADLLPYVGCILAVGPAALAATSRGLPVVLIVTAVLLAYQEAESRFIVPRVYGRVLRLPSAIVLIALLIGGSLMGVLGALLALPAAAALRMLMLAFRGQLPGERVDDEHWRARDEQAERQYEERCRDAPTDQAASIAVQISRKRLSEEGELALDVPMTSGEKPSSERRW
jgi:predicted PurR-regulated permease PerM